VCVLSLFQIGLSSEGIVTLLWHTVKIKRYDMIEEFNVDYKDKRDQLNLAHETKTNKRQCQLKR